RRRGGRAGGAGGPPATPEVPSSPRTATRRETPTMIRPALLALSVLVTAPAFAQQAAPAPAPSDKDIARDDEIAELRRQLATVVGELEQLRAQVAAPEIPPALESENGFGPAASKVYSLTRGVSVGGYVEGHYANAVGDAR